MPIRRAHVADAPAIAKVHVDGWRSTYRGLVPDDFLASLSYAQREQLWRRILSESEPDTCVYVAEDQSGTVVGFASGGRECRGDPTYTGELYAIYLLEAYQGQGIGRQLTMAVVNRLIEAGMASLLIWVLAENPARGFYEALGGQPVYHKTVTIGGAQLREVGYGWRQAGVILGRGHAVG